MSETVTLAVTKTTSRNDLLAACYFYNEENKALKSENESLKGSLEEWKLDFNALQAENENLEKVIKGQRDTYVNSKAYWEEENTKLRAALEELTDLMQGVIEGDYKPDSFTLQPAREALND